MSGDTKRRKQKKGPAKQMRTKRIQPASCIQLEFVHSAFVSPAKGKDKGKIFFALRAENDLSVFPVREDGRIVPQEVEGFSLTTLINTFIPKRLGISCDPINWA